MADSNDIVYTLRVQADSQSGTQQMGADVKNATEQAQQAVNQLNGTLQAQNEWFKQTTQSVNANSEAAKTHAANIASLNNQYEALMGKLDPVAGATTLYNQRLKLLDDAMKANVITSGQHADATMLVTAALDAVEAKAAKAAAGVVETDVASKAATSTLNALGMTTNMTVREFRAMADELASGRMNQFDGTLINVLSHALAANPAIIGTAAAITAVAVAVGSYLVVMAKGEEEQNKMTQAIVMSGNMAGQTTDSMRAMAAQIEQMGGNVGVAKDALTQLVASGKFTADSIMSIATAATEMEQTTGQKVETTVGQFEKLGESPVEASLKLNESMHYLTLEVFNQIEALAQHGDKLGAAQVAEEAYAEAIGKRTSEIDANLGSLQRAWREVKDMASSAWDAMLNIGKSQTIDQQIADVEKQLDAAKQGGSSIVDPNTGGTFSTGDTAALQQQLALLQEKKRLQQQSADRDGEIAKGHEEAVEAARQVDLLSQRVSKQNELNKALDEYHALNDKIRNDPNGLGANDPRLAPEYVANVEAGIRRTHQTRGVSHQGEKDQNADQNLALQQYKDQLQQENDANKDSTALIKSEYQAKLISEQEYYTQSANLIGEHLNDILTADANERKVWEEAAARATTKQQADKAQQQLDKLATTDKIAIADAITKETELLNTHTAAVNHDRDALQGYVDTLQKENDSRQKTVNNQIAALGMGTREAALYQQLEAIHQEYYQKLEALDLQHQKDGTSGDKKYEDDKNALKQATDQAVLITQSGYDRMTVAQQKWSDGVKAGFENFQDQANNAAKMSEQAFSDFANGMTSAIVQFAETGKLSFSSMAQSVIKDILKMEVEAAESKIFQLIGSLASSYFGSGAFINGSAGGASLGVTGSGAPMGFGGAHSGAIAGGSDYTFTRDADPSIFSGAPRFHSGGIVDGEVPIIAQAGEAVMPTVRLSNGQLGVQMAGDAGGGGTNVTVPVSMTVTYQAGQGGGGQGNGNDQNNMNDFSNKLAQQLQSAVDQRISQWAANATRPGGALSGTQSNRFGGG